MVDFIDILRSNRASNKWYQRALADIDANQLSCHENFWESYQNKQHYHFDILRGKHKPDSLILWNDNLDEWKLYKANIKKTGEDVVEVEETSSTNSKDFFRVTISIVCILLFVA